MQSLFIVSLPFSKSHVFAFSFTSNHCQDIHYSLTSKNIYSFRHPQQDDEAGQTHPDEEKTNLNQSYNYITNTGYVKALYHSTKASMNKEIWTVIFKYPIYLSIFCPI